MLQKFSDLKATLFDLAQAASQAPSVLNAAQVADRCQIVAGSFFQPETIPANGDIYLFSRVLLNWSDGQVVEILKNCKSIMPANAKLLILEFIADKNLGTDELLTSLNLLVMFGARARSRTEFEVLLTEAGFGGIRWITVGDSNRVFFLEAAIVP